MKPIIAALTLLLAAQGAALAQEEDDPRAQIRVSVRDAARSFTFDLYPDGRIELTVPEGTYKAGSLDEFKEKHADVAAKYEIDRYVPHGIWLDRHTKAWQQWVKRFHEWFDPAEFERRMEEFCRRFHEERRARLGIRIEGVDEALAAQLGLKPGEGLLVTEVRPGSRAEKAGLRKYDVILKMNGRAVADLAAFRKDVREQLAKGFELEIVREGRHETIAIAPLGKGAGGMLE